MPSSKPRPVTAQTVTDFDDNLDPHTSPKLARRQRWTSDTPKVAVKTEKSATRGSKPLRRPSSYTKPSPSSPLKSSRTPNSGNSTLVDTTAAVKGSSTTSPQKSSSPSKASSKSATTRKPPISRPSTRPRHRLPTVQESIKTKDSRLEPDTFAFDHSELSSSLDRQDTINMPRAETMRKPKANITYLDSTYDETSPRSARRMREKQHGRTPLQYPAAYDRFDESMSSEDSDPDSRSREDQKSKSRREHYDRSRRDTAVDSATELPTQSEWYPEPRRNQVKFADDRNRNADVDSSYFKPPTKLSYRGTESRDSGTRSSRYKNNWRRDRHDDNDNDDYEESDDYDDYDDDGGGYEEDRRRSRPKHGDRGRDRRSDRGRERKSQGGDRKPENERTSRIADLLESLNVVRQQGNDGRPFFGVEKKRIKVGKHSFDLDPNHFNKALDVVLQYRDLFPGVSKAFNEYIGDRQNRGARR